MARFVTEGKRRRMVVLIVIVILAMIGILLAFAHQVGEGSTQTPRKLELSGRGVRAEAVVIDARQEGASVSVQPEVEFTLEVRPANGPPYRAKAFKSVSIAQAYRCKPGTVLEVLYDPENPSIVAIQGF